LLFLLGDGEVELYKRVISDNKIFDKVIIHSPVDYNEVPKYISICDVGIVPLPNIPDWRYQSPLKLVEYLAMKKPVIATDIPANRELIANNECGIYLSAVNPTAIAAAIAYAYDNKEKLLSCTKSEKIPSVDEYDWVNVARQLKKYICEIELQRK
jgi:glycosyltransferase involved in cell wall biosynthesis